jgi:hypothetical protein
MGHRDAPSVTPADVCVNLGNRLGSGKSASITRIEELGLQATEEAFACAIVPASLPFVNRPNELFRDHAFQPAGPAIIAFAISVDYGSRFAVSGALNRCI